MNKKKLILLVVVLFVVIAIICVILLSEKFQIFQDNLDNNIVQKSNDSSKKIENIKDISFMCSNDADCEFVFIKMEENCEDCSYSSTNWVCFGKELAEQERAKWVEQHKNIFCEKCLESETDFDKFECKCINNTCVKNNK